MKILYLTHNRKDIGGSYMRAFSLAREVARHAHEVTLIASRQHPGCRSQNTFEDKVRILQPPDLLPARLRHGGLSPMDAVMRVQHALGNHYDLVHAFDHRPAVLLPTLTAGWFRRTPIISDWADLWGSEGIASLRGGVARRIIGTLDGWMEENTRRFADGVTYTSAVLKEKALQQGVDPDAVLFLPPGANVDLIRPLDKTAMREKYALPDKAKIAAYIGFAPYDSSFLASVTRMILEEIPDAYVIVCGGRQDSLDQELDDRTRSDRLLSFGFVPYEQLGEILALADVLLLPYRSSTVNLGRFPNKFGDYLASGRPILTHDTGEVGRAVKHYRVGVVAGEAPTDFVRAFEDLVADRYLLEALGANARNLALNQYGWSEIGAAVLDLYQRVISSHMQSGDSSTVDMV